MSTENLSSGPVVKKTFNYYAKELNLCLTTVKRKGKAECERLLKLKISEGFNHFLVDEDTRKKATLVLNEAITWLSGVKDNPRMTDYQKSQIMVKLTKIIAGGKG